MISTFRAQLLAVPPSERDAWVDRVLGLGELPDDGPQLPSGGVPYLPSSVDVLLRAIERADIGAADVFVDLGCGAGRAATLVHLLTGAETIGLEIQPHLVHSARELASRLQLTGVEYREGDASELVGALTEGTVFFLYCPFGGEVLGKALAHLEAISRRSAIRVCCVDLPLPPCDFLTAEPGTSADLVVYRSS